MPQTPYFITNTKIYLLVGAGWTITRFGLIVVDNPCMKPSKKESESSDEENQSLEFKQGLEEIEQALVALRERYQQVECDRNLQGELQERAAEIRQSQLPEMKAELKHIQQQLEVLEINLESRLFSWHSIKDPFWQIIRFSGLGVIIGWLLKSFAG
jgi:hypothetical protein